MTELVNPGKIRIAPSLLAADLTHLGEELANITKGPAEATADYIHMDIMDGHFVSNLSFGPSFVSALRPLSDKPFDVHLMTMEPSRFIEDFAKSGADILTVHQEASPHLDRDLQSIRNRGMRAGVALNPSTDPETIFWILDRLDLVLVMSVNPGFGGQEFIPSALEKIEKLKRIIGKRPIDIEIDGGVSPSNAAQLAKAGASILVAGSSIFQSDDAKSMISSLRTAAQRGLSAP